MSAFLDTNVVVRHLVGDPPAQAHRATTYLRDEHELLLADLIVAEVVYVLESFYEAPRGDIVASLRSLLALDAVIVTNRSLLERALEHYELDRLDFAEAYLVALAEATGIGRVASFDQSIDRVSTVERLEP